MKAALLKADRWLWGMDIVLMSLSGLAVLAMMLITFVDVFMRYALHSPLAWSYDLITQYLLLAAFFFAFSYALRTNENVVVDFFARKLPLNPYCVLMCVGHGAIAVIFACITWLTAADTYVAWENGEAFFGALVWSTWTAKMIVPIGALALTLRLAHRSLVYGVGVGDRAFLDSAGLEAHDAALLEKHV